MTKEEIRLCCLAKSGVTEELPFDDVTLVYKVGGKMFALVDAESKALSLKCDPDKALELRASYESVQPGWHLNKRHWITVELAGDVPKNEIYSWIDDSYALVAASLTKKQRLALVSTGEENGKGNE